MPSGTGQREDHPMISGGGKKKAALRPILGRDKVVRFMQGSADPDATAELRTVNGGPAPAVLIDGEVDTHIEEGLVAGMYAVRNREKLHHLEEAVTLAR
jgi:hypothetical protein